MIIKMWGQADSYPLVFNKTKCGDWRVSVPADLSDGRYITSIFAEDESGLQTIWTGILYMVDSRFVYIRLCEDSFHAILLPDRQVSKMCEERFSISPLPLMCGNYKHHLDCF